MSAKNKLQAKSIRRQQRLDAGTYLRTPASEPVPRQIATKILVDPKYKVNARIRRKLTARRDVVLELPRQEPKHPAVKLALQLQRLPLEKLRRRLAQAARRASTCKNLIAELSPGSQFAAGIVAEQTNQLSAMRQISAEIKSRNV